ncbi:MAG: hemolysin III family protein [Nocardioidaceae bacterium]|nr:hemolysin III family protein [Nocardioidaceae bacterium]MCL2613924.1 hemolysin III family protein [Nocardioidaceae bacterium]
MNQAIDNARERAHAGIEQARHDVSEAIAEVKPKLRGWLHAISTPLIIAAGTVLITLSPTAATRIGSSLYVASALLLFGVSAIYHRGKWSPRVWQFLNRLDHSNIYLFIAGSYTPFAITLLHGAAQWWMLGVVWTGALIGVALQLLWPNAPRWLSAPVYIALGWAAIFFIPSFLSGAEALGVGIGVAIFVLIVVGGALYTLGGLVYGFKWPDPAPRSFGFHEVFHSFTVVAFITQYVGVSMATYALR